MSPGPARVRCNNKKAVAGPDIPVLQRPVEQPGGPGLHGFLPLDTDAEVEVDVLARELILEVLGEAGIGGGMRALWDCTAEHGLGVR